MLLAVSECTRQTLNNPYVQWAIANWYWLVIGAMALWIGKRGVR